MKFSEKQINDFATGQLSESDKQAFQKELKTDAALEEQVIEKVVENLTLKELERNRLKAKMKTWEQERRPTRVVQLKRALRVAASIALLGVVVALILPFINKPVSNIKSIEQTISNSPIVGNWVTSVEGPTSQLKLNMQLNSDETFALNVLATYKNNTQKAYQLTGGGQWTYSELDKTIQFNNLSVELASQENRIAIQPILIDIEAALQQLGFNEQKVKLNQFSTNELELQQEDRISKWAKNN